MTNFRDYIVVEFDFHARFFNKSTLQDFNERKKSEYQNRAVSTYKYVIAVYETEKEADEFIKENKQHIEDYCKIFSQSNEIFDL